MEASGASYRPLESISKEEQDKLIEAMEVAGMHFDEIDSSPDSLRFTSELGIVTYFESWDEITNWIEGTVFDDPDVEQEVDESCSAVSDPKLSSVSPVTRNVPAIISYR